MNIMKNFMNNIRSLGASMKNLPLFRVLNPVSASEILSNIHIARNPSTADAGVNLNNKHSKTSDNVIRPGCFPGNRKVQGGMLPGFTR